MVIVHEWWGHNEHTRRAAQKLADAGYVGFAIDMYGTGKVTSHPDTAGMFMPGRPVEIASEEHFAQISLMIPHDHLQLELQNLLGRDLSHPLEFRGDIDMMTPGAQTMMQLLRVIDTASSQERGLLAHADVVTVDLPGWGAADLLPQTYGVDFLAAALDRLLDDLGLTHINMLAGSYGTGIAYRLAQVSPHRVARMALIGTMTEIPEHAAAAFRHTLELLAAGRMDEFASATVGSPVSSS